MRVNISYSLNLDEIPDEVERLLIECDQKIRKIHGDLVETIGRDPLIIIQELDTIRREMALADLRLDDCMQILNGYVQTVANLPLAEQGHQPSEEIQTDE